MRYGRRFPSWGSILLVVLGVVLLLSRSGEGERGRNESPRRSAPAEVQALVVSVTDGDTARVRIDGRERSVRYIGIDTPESVIPGERPECFGKRAARLNERLVEGERVRLVFGAEKRDFYDRLLAYVYRRGRLVNAQIIRRGYARTLAIAPNTDYAERFARLQQAAANTGRGLWGTC
jgi:micrococcal nuclease